MRRHELGVQDDAFLAEVARGALVGHLALATPDGPRAVALNFALADGAIWYHGAQAGEKFATVAHGAPVGFTMTMAYSLIPSSWSAPAHACPATHFFKSVEVRGSCAPVDDPVLKARGLQAIMEKYQPERNFTPISADLPMYKGALKSVGVFRVVIESWTGKRKFGQNEPEKLRRLWVEKLRERGTELDLATADEIARSLP
ncbi:MAG: pyridoxamine 5'-phosphate oxidase family protein [bacterium]|nr:pyridoxamine 5'-phosphate oxidase family protein [bacterium]